MIIGITGKIGSGKSTTAEILVKNGYTEYSMSSPLKEIGKVFGFTHEQLYGSQEQKLQIHPHWGCSARTFLQKAGTELFRETMPKVIPEMKIEHTIWIDLFKLKYQRDPKSYVISDVRFLDEANVIKELGGIIIRTVRDNKISSDNKIEHVHRSELEMESIIPDYIIDNNILSKEDLYTALAKIIQTKNIHTLFYE